MISSEPTATEICRQDPSNCTVLIDCHQVFWPDGKGVPQYKKPPRVMHAPGIGVGVDKELPAFQIPRVSKPHADSGSAQTRMVRLADRSDARTSAQCDITHPSPAEPNRSRKAIPLQR